MSDISMCEGAGEKLCEKCYRKNAVPNEYRQSWIDPLYKDDACPMFYEMEIKK